MKLLSNFLCCALGSSYTGQSFKNYGLFEFEINSEEVAKKVEQLDSKFLLDWFKPHNGASYNVGEKVQFLSLPKNRAFIAKSLNGAGVENLNQINNLDSLIEKSFDGPPQARVGGTHDLTVYHTFEEIENWLTTEVDSHVDASVVSIGTTHENRDIWSVNIFNKPDNFVGEAPKIIVDCGIHAREWASYAFCQHFIYQLLWGDYQEWKDNINWIVYPAFNPDGYAYSWNTKRYQRKNRSPNAGSNCKGTDLNRNYDVDWMASGTSSNPCSDTYGGASAFSEKESQAHRDHQTPLEYKKAYLTYHAYSEVIIYPYSTSYAAEAWNKAELNSIAGKMSTNIRSVHGKNYEYGEGAPFFYPAAGGSDDWSHSIGIPLSFTIELRDTGTYGFLLPESQLQPNGEENMEGIRAVYDHVEPTGGCSLCHADAHCTYNGDDDAFICTCNEGFTGNGLNSCQSIIAESWKWGAPILTGLNRFRCGPAFNADCESDGGVPCCSAGSWCGSSNGHCNCPTCVDFRQETTPGIIINDEIINDDSSWTWGPPVTTGLNRFRCGIKYGADCESDGAHCCSAGSWCGSSNNHCNCATCVDFSLDVDNLSWTWGPPIISGTNRYRCGPEYNADCGGSSPCCSAGGWCGKTNGHCACATCVDFSTKDTRRKNGGN